MGTVAPIEKALEYAHTNALIERFAQLELDGRMPVRKLRRRLRQLEEELCELVTPGQVRVFQVMPDQAIVIYSHCYGGQDWREVRLTRLERLEA